MLVLSRCPISVAIYAQIPLQYSEQTGYITVEFKWTCNVVDVVQSQVLYKHILNVEVSERLSVFERKILRKMFGPTKGDNGNWRI
jgi:hypothetical protein